MSFKIHSLAKKVLPSFLYKDDAIPKKDVIEQPPLIIQAEDKNIPQSNFDNYYRQLWTAQKKEEDLKVSTEDYFRRIDLMKQLSEEQRDKVFKDLQMQHVGFWRNLIPYAGYGLAGLVNGSLRLPLYIMRSAARVSNGILPEFIIGSETKKDISEKIENLIERSKQKGVIRRERIVAPFEKLSSPESLEMSIDNNPMFEKLNCVIDAYSNDGAISLQTVEKLLEQITNNSAELKVDKSSAETFVASFPFLQKLSEIPDTVTKKTIEIFKQNIKDSIPFLYELYGQKVNKYIEANLVYLGAAEALPEMSPVKKTGRNLSNKLNENPTYRKIARWAKENQLSDTQFLPVYSFVDALYGQTSAVVTGLVKEFSMSTVFEQMIALDGVFNGVNFWITKFQILLVGWDKEKPERQRAQYEKELKSICREKELIENQLKEEQKKLTDAITATPDRANEITLEFERETLNPLIQRTNELTANMEKFQHKLNKLLGIEDMGFVEKMWKKPPQLLNDLKIMVPISIPLTLVYELLYINRYTDFEIEPISAKFAMLVSYMTFLGAIGNVILKQIIHLTQDRTKLYIEGKKDELLCTNTREFLAGLRGSIDDLKESNDENIQALCKDLEEVYTEISKPLIGDSNEQANTEKTLSREAKLDFSIKTTETIKLMMSELKNHTDSLQKSPEYNTCKVLYKYMKALLKVMDKAAYSSIDSTKFQLKALADHYRKEIIERDREKLIPEHQSRFFKNTITSSIAYLEALEKQYPIAELPFELLLLRADENHDELQKVFTQGMSLTETDSEIREAFDHCKNNATDKEDRRIVNTAKKAVKHTHKGLKKDLRILEAKSKEEAQEELKNYKQERIDYSKATQEMSLSLEKLKRLGMQSGMTLKHTGKNLAYIEKYNRWISGIPWIPAHSLLNVAGRIGLTSIVQGMILPLPVMLKVWLMFHIPIRLYIFFTEKFMLDRDHFHRKHAEVTKKMEHGIEEYIKQMVEKDKQPIVPLQ